MRSDRAHARIVRLDISKALAAPGVVDVLIGDDLRETGWKGLPSELPFKGIDGSSLRVPFRGGLACGRVRFVGEPIAFIVAESEYIAQDAAELIDIEYEDLPVLVDAADALSAGAVSLHEEFSDNLAFEFEYGDEQETQRAFAAASHIARVQLCAQRIAGNPIEPKSCVASYDSAGDVFELCIPTQGAEDIRSTLSYITGGRPEQFRIRSQDVGGSFGVRNEIYPEYLAIMLAAKRNRRPIKWVGTRSESILGDHHGRAAQLTGELALDKDGLFLGLRVQWLVNQGAYCSNAGPLINTGTAPRSGVISLYNVPAVYGRHRLVFTNTTPTTAYRGAGRPNVSYLWERLVETAARGIGIDSIELRRRNILRKNMFPFRTPTKSTYDSADPERLLTSVLTAADWSGFESRRKQASLRGQLRGIGLALFLEPSGGVGKEEVEIRVRADGRLEMYALMGPSGQGHETVFPALISKILGVPEDRIELRYNDVNAPRLSGIGTFGSRSLISHGSGLLMAAKELIEKARTLAAQEFEVEQNDVIFHEGIFRVTGTDLTISIQSLIESVPDHSAAHALNTNVTIDLSPAFPSGAHVAEVEIDPETGKLRVANYIAVDDCGIVYNQILLEGQMHGGIGQGLGQIIGEHVVYDPLTGQLLSGTLMDYSMPRADQVPPITLIDCGVASPANPLGAKGAGEAGATGSIPALANAVLNALQAVGIEELDAPYTPDRIWRAIYRLSESCAYGNGTTAPRSRNRA